MKRVIVDYAKLTNEILNLLVEKFPEGYDDTNIIRFKNHKDEAIEAVEVRTEDTIYLVKISTKLSDRMISYDEDEDIIVPLESVKGIDLGEDDIEEDDEDEEIEEKIEFDDEDDIDDDKEYSKKHANDDEDDDDED
jgi:DNA-directed RNA polymerase subunit delta